MTSLQSLVQTILPAFIQLDDNESYLVEGLPHATTRLEASVYRMPKKAGMALVAALASGRPLLITGEPGVGKTQLAKAAAKLFKRHFMSTVIQPHTQYQDLLWSVDHTARLADAQLFSTVSPAFEAGEEEKRDRYITEVHDNLAVSNYVSPGPLWWALNWTSAESLNGSGAYKPEPVEADQGLPNNGIVCLIDEIDKGSNHLTEGLLDIFGSGCFSVPHFADPISQSTAPLFILSSNKTRSLPKAFMRRCAVLDLSIPGGTELQSYLYRLGKDHFGDRICEQAATRAAECIVKDRESQPDDKLRSGVAEYLDLLRCLSQQDKGKQLALVEEFAEFFYKHE